MLNINNNKISNRETKIGILDDSLSGIDLNGQCFLPKKLFPGQVQDKLESEGYILDMIVVDRSTGKVKKIPVCYDEDMKNCLEIGSCYEPDVEEGEMLGQLDKSRIPVSTLQLFENKNMVVFLEDVISSVAHWVNEQENEDFSPEEKFYDMLNAKACKLERTIDEERISNISDCVTTKINNIRSYYDNLNVRSISGLLYSKIHKHFKVRQIADLSSSDFDNVISFISNIDVTEIAKIAKKVA